MFAAAHSSRPGLSWREAQWSSPWTNLWRDGFVENMWKCHRPVWSRYIQIWWNMIKRYKTLVQHISAPHEKHVPSWRAMPSVAKFLLWPADCVRAEDRLIRFERRNYLLAEDRWCRLQVSNDIKRHHKQDHTEYTHINTYKYTYTNTEIYKYIWIPSNSQGN